MTKHTFDWQAEPEGFWKWAFVVLATPLRGKPDIFEPLAKASEDFTKVEVTVLLNGIEVDAKALLEGLNRNFDYCVSKEAQEKISEAGFTDLFQQIHEAEKAIKKEVISRLAAVGIQMPESEDY